MRPAVLVFSYRTRNKKGSDGTIVEASASTPGGRCTVSRFLERNGGRSLVWSTSIFAPRRSSSCIITPPEGARQTKRAVGGCVGGSLSVVACKEEEKSVLFLRARRNAHGERIKTIIIIGGIYSATNKKRKFFLN